MKRIPDASALFEEAAFEPETLPTAMEKVAAELGYDHFFFAHIEFRQPAYIAPAHTLALLDDYAADGWHLVDDRGTYCTRVRPGEIFRDDKLVPNDIRATSVIYNEFYRKQNIPWNTGWKIAIGGDFWAFSFLRSDERGPATDADVALLKELAPSANRTALLARQLREVRIRGMADGLVASGVACLLLDHAGRVSLTTPKARDLFSEDFGVTRGSMWASDPRSNAGLASIAKSSRERPVSWPLHNVLIHRRPPHRPILARPVCVRGAGLDQLPGTRVIVTLADLDEEAGVPPEDLRLAFSLSEAEADITAMMANGLSLPEIAARRRSTLGTVRVQLKNVFKKLDVNRQSDIVRLVERVRRAPERGTTKGPRMNRRS